MEKNMAKEKGWRKRRMKRIRAAADVSQVEKWEAQLGASGGINIQKRRTREGGAVRRSNNALIGPMSDHCLAVSLTHSVLYFSILLNLLYFFKLLHGFVKIDKWISLSCLYGFVNVAT